jgi:hypothetical protein
MRMGGGLSAIFELSRGRRKNSRLKKGAAARRKINCESPSRSR